MSNSEISRLAARAELSPRVLKQALEWLVTLWSREATEEQLQALARWRAADDEHERAWRYVERINDKFATAPPPLASRSLRSARTRVGRRRVLQALCVLLVGGTATYSVRNSGLIQVRLADARTATGEIRDVVLDDGTRVTLNTASAINLRFTPEERRVQLVEGEVIVATAPDPAPMPRPFVVETAEGSIAPIGTRFGVRRRGDEAEVAVFEGSVLVRPRLDGVAAVRLDAGERAGLSAAAVTAIGPVDQFQDAWSRGTLVVERMRLADFLAELNRYRPGLIRCHRDVADLIVSGTYPLPDTDRILAALAWALPIRVRILSPYWVMVDGRGSAGA